MSKIIVKTIYSLGENTEKHNIFSSNRKEVTRIDKSGEEITKITS